MTSNSSRCAACKALRRKCPNDCILAPHFPPSDPRRFAYVHRIFGAGNVTRMLQQIPERLRREAADCMSFEASCRVSDPVCGCVRTLSQLQHHIAQLQLQILKTETEIARRRFAFQLAMEQ